jgi:hypothetical protein
MSVTTATTDWCAQKICHGWLIGDRAPVDYRRMFRRKSLFDVL